jgi:hypothetical protein
MRSHQSGSYWRKKKIILVLVNTTHLRKKEFMERGRGPSNRLALCCLEKRANCEK